MPNALEIANTSLSPKRVFVSYKMDIGKWNDTVWGFVATLEGDGFRVNVATPTLDLDGMTIAEWSRKQVIDAEVVLVCCSPKYKEVVDRVQEPGMGLGVAVEVTAIRQELYESAGINRKYIPVLLPDVTPESIPDLLNGYPRVAYPQDYELLKQYLVGIRSAIEFEQGTTLRVNPPRRIPPDPSKP